MIDLQTVSIVIAAVSVVIGVANSILNNERAERRRQLEQETRQAEFYMQFYKNTYEYTKHWQDVLYRQDWKTWDEYWEKYSSRVNPEAAAKVLEVARRYETLGSLVREKLIDPKFLYKQDPHSAVLTWERLKPIVMGVRKNLNITNWGKSFEYLVNLMREMQKQEESKQL